MPSARSYYEILNVSPEAEPVVVEAAYKALMKKYHPDQGQPTRAAKDVSAINEAFAVIKDPARRAEYDHRLWTRQQAMKLAELQGRGLRPRSRWAGIGGWLVAVAMGCALIAMAAARNPDRGAAPAALLVGAQPSAEEIIKAAAVKAAEADDAQVQAGLARAALLRPPIEAKPQTRRLPSLEARPANAARAYPRMKRRLPVAEKRTAAPPEPAPPDFLERQGYIY